MSNNESAKGGQVSNVEYQRQEFCLFKQNERSEADLQHSAVGHSILCGSLSF
jgi:hypothetical protein